MRGKPPWIATLLVVAMCTWLLVDMYIFPIGSTTNASQFSNLAVVPLTVGAGAMFALALFKPRLGYKYRLVSLVLWQETRRWSFRTRMILGYFFVGMSFLIIIFGVLLAIALVTSDPQ